MTNAKSLYIRIADNYMSLTLHIGSNRKYMHGLKKDNAQINFAHTIWYRLIAGKMFGAA